MRVIDWRPFAKKWNGIDYAELRCILEEVKGDPGDPIAPRTPLGWTCNW